MLSALINSNKDTMIELADALESFAFPKDEEFDEEATLTLIAKLSNDAILQYNIWKNSDNHLLFNAIVKFLQKLQYEKGLQVGRLLRILPAHTGEVKKLYLIYAVGMYQQHPVSKYGADPVNLLFSVTKYFFDGNGEKLQFTGDDRFIDLMLFRALGCAPHFELTAELRILLWKYIALKKYRVVANCHLPDYFDQIDINKPLSAPDIQGLNNLWSEMAAALLSSSDKKKFKQLQRGILYTRNLETQHGIYKMLAPIFLFTEVSVIRERLLSQLILYMNMYGQLLTLSSEHQQLFDRLLIKATGNKVQNIEDDSGRLYCLELLLLDEWKNRSNHFTIVNQSIFSNLSHQDNVARVKREIESRPYGHQVCLTIILNTMQAFSLRINEAALENANRVVLTNGKF